jgi:hypothetical protein
MQPKFSVVRRGVDERSLDEFCAKALCARNGGVEVADLEPENDAVADPRLVSIHETGMVFNIPGVELKNHSPVLNNSVIDVAMRMLGQGLRRQELSVPAAARPNVTNGD